MKRISNAERERGEDTAPGLGEEIDRLNVANVSPWLPPLQMAAERAGVKFIYESGLCIVQNTGCALVFITIRGDGSYAVRVKNGRRRARIEGTWKSATKAIAATKGWTG